MDRVTLQTMSIDELRRHAEERGISATDELERDQLVAILSTPSTPTSTSAKPRPTSTAAKGGQSRLDVPSSTTPARPVDNDPEAMARVYIAQGEPERAAEIYRTLLAKSPHDRQIAALLVEAEDAIVAKDPTPLLDGAASRPRESRPQPAASPRESVESDRVKPSAARIEPAPGEPFGMLDFEEPPDGYGVDECELVARDPFHLFTYWEVTEQGLGDARQHLGDEADGARLILRMFTTTSAEKGVTRDTRDHELGSHRGRRYLPSPRPGALVRAAIGLVTPSGLFAPIANSSTVRIPAAEPAPPAQPEWIEVIPARRDGLDNQPIQVVRNAETASHGERGLPGHGLPGAAPTSPPETVPAAGETTSPPGSWRWRPGSGS